MHIDELFQKAVESKSSDLHLVVGMPPILRINGDLRVVPNYEALTPNILKELIYNILTTDEQLRLEKDKELDISYAPPSSGRFRINLHFEKGNLGVVARFIPVVIPSLEDVHMPEIVKPLLRLDQGLILVTGPTGCGKTTALASMIDFINKDRACHIITLEDPIEFIFSSAKSIIRQRQYGHDMISFGEGLKHALRQDPNVIMVGEMRDLETVATTITLAETGHLVLATLHTNNAEQTINRIIDIFPPYHQQQVRLQLSLTLQAVISQRLLPLKDHSGRVAVRELMLNTPAVANLIRENKTHQIKHIMQTSLGDGMLLMDRGIRDVYQKGLISKDIAIRYMFSPELLDR